MLGRALRLGGIFLAALALMVISVAGFVAWRLATGHPIRLTFLKPILQESLAKDAAPARVEADDIVLAWKLGEQPLGLQVLGLHVIGKDGQPVASVRRVGVEISLFGLLRGRVSPVAIDIFNPEVSLRRDPSGAISLLGIDSSSPPGTAAPLEQWSPAAFLGPSDPSRVNDRLSRLSIVGGSLTFEDRKAGLTWHAANIDIEVERHPGEIDGRLSARVTELGSQARVGLRASLDASTGKMTMHGSYQDVDIVSLGSLAPALGLGPASRLQLDGEVDALANIGGEFGPVHVTTLAGAGTLDLPGRLAEPLTIAKLSLDGRMEAGFDSASLESLMLDLGGPVLTARGQISGLHALLSGAAGHTRLRCNLAARELPVGMVHRLWPLAGEQGSTPRNWFADHIDEGRIENAAVSLELEWAGGDPAHAEIANLAANMKASGVGLQRLQSLPPIRGADLEAAIDGSTAMIDIATGAMGGLQIRQARLSIAGLDQADQAMDLEGDVEGPFRDAMLLLDRAGVVNFRGTGIKPADTDGMASAHVKLQAPSLQNLSFETLRPQVTATVRSGRLPGVFAGYDVSAANFDIHYDGRIIVVSGSAKLAGIPAKIQSERRAKDSDLRVTISADPRIEDLARVGLDYRDIAEGSIPVKLVYRQAADSAGTITIDADLAPTTIALPEIKWRKAAGIGGNIHAALEMKGGKPAAIPAFDFQAGGLMGNGRARFSRDGDLTEVVIERVALGETRLSNVTIAIGAGRADIAVGGGTLDAAPLLDRTETLGVEAPSLKDASPRSADKAPSIAYFVKVDRLDHLLLGDGREIDSLGLTLAYDGHYVQSIVARGILLGGGPFDFSWAQSGPSMHQLSVTAGDAGAALKALHIFDDAVGGRLTITGQSRDGEEGRPITGHIDVSEYHIVHQSALLHLFLMATLTGLADSLSGQGILMNRFTGDFRKRNGRVEVPLARTAGPSLGLSASGYFDFDLDQIDFKGTIVPVNTLNSIIGGIPLVGGLITGGQGNGIGAVDYTATGKLSEPTLKAYPLSAVTPGFLRWIFDSGTGGDRQPTGSPSGN